MNISSSMPTLAFGDALTQSPKQKIFAHQAKVPLQANILYRIERGVVRSITWDEEGVPILLGYWAAGDVIGQPLTCVTPYQLECLTSVEVVALPIQMWSQVIEAIALHVQQTEELLRIASLKPLPVRFWQLLLWLGKKFGRDVAAGRLIDLKLTHQELAEAVNSTRVTVTRTLQQFEQEGRLVRQKKRLILPGE